MSECTLASFTKQSFVTSKLAYWEIYLLYHLSLCFRRKQTSETMVAKGRWEFIFSSKQAYWLQNFASYGSL